jgi:hypothetical protein
MTNIIETKETNNNDKNIKKHALVFISKTANLKQNACLTNLGFEIDILTF